MRNIPTIFCTMLVISSYLSSNGPPPEELLSKTPVITPHTPGEPRPPEPRSGTRIYPEDPIF